MPTRRIIGPSEEPLTLAETKLHLRVDSAHEDAYISALIVAAREQAEQITGRALVNSTFVQTEDQFPSAIKLRPARVSQIVEVRFRDIYGVMQLLSSANYTLDNASEFVAWLYPSANYTWPSTWAHPNGVEVEFVAGFGATRADVPQSIKQWMLLTVAQWYSTREAIVDRGSEMPSTFYSALLAPHLCVEA